MKHETNNELTHYGVLGMKWGVRRANKTGGTYKYKSLDTKVYEKKAAKAKERGNTEKYKKFQQYSKKSAEFDKKLQDVATNMSAGRTIATVLLSGTSGAKTYAAAQAHGYNKTVSTAMSTVMGMLSGPIGNVILTANLRDDYVTGRFSGKN
jgi:hypothetical protein